MLDTFTSFQLINGNLTRSLNQTAATPSVKRESDYYLANIRNVKTIDDFLGNDRLFKYAMKAYGLEDMDYAKAFMRKALEGGIDDKDSFANKLSDSRYTDFVTAFNFARYGTATTSFDRTQQGTVDAYVRQTLETNSGSDNEGVRLALYFERKAPTVTSTLDLLGDPALLKVVQTALGLSEATGAGDIDAQVKMISAKLDVADLKDPDKLKSFLQRFTSLYDLNNSSTDPASPAILFSQPLEAGVGADLLMALQGLKLGGA